ncbi:MAG: hypothetical protein IPK44_01625 [Candidatus Accumulibacter sp.]|uniref:GDSL-type esterase/lipase family protein n=1 Tax=Accumulibacter sp. TaxID=2053492 RepID=UPI002582905F|nr:GDSL-type esterase/lipase family protein [Accumulibacter sp.]MBK8113300.1 hypothetical protein [Accumulibacter sp.]
MTRTILATQTANLIGYWPLDEAAGVTAQDASPNNRDGTYAGTLALAQTGIGDGRTAVKFTAGAVNLYAALNAAAFAAGECTFMVWAKGNDAAHMADGVNEYLWDTFATAGQCYFGKYPSVANLLRMYYVAGGVTKYVDLYRYDARWNQYAFSISKSGEIAAAYINGSLAATVATLGVWSGTLNANLNCLGATRADSYTNPFKGTLAHGAIWSKALTGAEIRNIHDAARTCVGVMVCGDSKSTAAYQWPRKAMDLLASDTRPWEPRPAAYATSGWKASDLLAALQAGLGAEWATAHRAWVNIGANDLSAGTSEATYKANLAGIINALRAKYPTITIAVARPWIKTKNTESAAMKAWIGAVVATYASGVQLGPDETVWLENGDDGVTYTLDGIHYNSTGVTAAAAQWAALG